MYPATESRTLLDKTPVPQLVKDFPAIYGTRSFITAFICPYIKQIKPVHTLRSYFFNIHCNDCWVKKI